MIIQILKRFKFVPQHEMQDPMTSPTLFGTFFDPYFFFNTTNDNLLNKSHWVVTVSHASFFP